MLSSQLSAALKARHKDIAWKEVAGMRDKLIHGYFGVDLQVVWNTCREDLEVFKKALKKNRR